MSSSSAFIPPRTKVVFPGPSCGAKVSSKCRNRDKQKNSPSTQSPPSSALSDCNEGSSGSSRPNISSSAHLVRSNSSGSYSGLDDPILRPTLVSLSLPAFERGLSTPYHSGVIPLLLALPLPHPCKKCWELGYSVTTYNKGTSSKHKKRPHKASTYFGTSSPSAETTTVEKQQPYNAVPLADPSADPIFTEVVTVGEIRPKSLGHKRTKIVETEHPSSKQFATPKVVHILKKVGVALLDGLMAGCLFFWVCCWLS
uniref:Uncharacterized protein n=1 Tax=Populus alba TaxID=43335 RepID=A0A4U5QTC8_POPAL|nr:hypothetical protein D5086_0000065780 [Populus alba]